MLASCRNPGMLVGRATGAESLRSRRQSKAWGEAVAEPQVRRGPATDEPTEWATEVDGSLSPVSRAGWIGGGGDPGFRVAAAPLHPGLYAFACFAG